MRNELRSVYTVKLVGGALCLDFTNTVHSRRGPDLEYLRRYSDLLAWWGRAGVLTDSQCSTLEQRAQREPRQADKALRKALTTRELIYREIRNTARRSKPDDGDSRRFLQLFGQAISASHLVRKADRLSTEWELMSSLDAPLWPVIHSAGELLLSEHLGRVKECDTCGWLFLDRSKNQTRRWCRMNDCGAQAKMRRYLKRKKNN